ncbi:MAG TPA: transposase family protein, partial [Flavobacteriales bacterium]|nr:transposase family protein [Flavobacteriales bacterium]
MSQARPLLSYFEGLKDPRMERTQLHPMESLVFISVAAIACGADTWNEIESFGKAKQEWLGTVIQLPNEIPTHDTYNRFFSALEPGEF